MICRVCLKPFDRGVKSHISPKSSYKDTFGKSSMVVIVRDNGSVIRSPSGPYTRVTWCPKCERVFGDLDGYGDKVFKDDGILRGMPKKYHVTNYGFSQLYDKRWNCYMVDNSKPQFLTDTVVKYVSSLFLRILVGGIVCGSEGTKIAGINEHVLSEHELIEVFRVLILEGKSRYSVKLSFDEIGWSDRTAGHVLPCIGLPMVVTCQTVEGLETKLLEYYERRFAYHLHVEQPDFCRDPSFYVNNGKFLVFRNDKSRFNTIFDSILRNNYKNRDALKGKLKQNHQKS